MQITPRLHMLTIPFLVPLPSGPVERSVNLFLLAGERITLIDSGVDGAERELFGYLQTLGRRPEEVETLILTHSHPDHIGAARTIKRLTGCRVLAHAAERGWIEDTEMQFQQRPVPGFQRLVAGSVTVDRCLADGDRLDLGEGCVLEVLHTPGHSPGSISLWDRAGGVLVSGDAVPLPGDLPILDNMVASRKSLERLRACGAACLFSAWDIPRRGQAVQQGLDDGLAWLQRIGRAVELAAGNGPLPEPLELCRRVVPALGLPPHAVNPLVARSFMACLG